MSDRLASILRISLVLLCGCITALAGGQNSQQLAPALGQSLERELKSGESHSYQITLAEGDYLNLTVAYRGVVVAVAFNDPNGKLLNESGGGSETVDQAETAFIATAAGNYQVIVRGRGPVTDKGTYKFEIKALRAATEQDRNYVTAKRLMLESETLLSLRTAESRRLALAKLAEALPLWRAGGQLPQELETLRMIADTRFVLSEFPSAMEVAQELLGKARAAGLRSWELKGLKYVGSLQNSLNNQVAAQQTLEQALALARELGDRAEERGILNNLGVASSALGQRHTALGYYQQALKLAQELGDRTGTAVALRNLAIRYEGIGEPEQAFEHYQQAAAMRRALGALDLEALTKIDLARLQLRRGEFQRAFELASQARVALRAAGRKDEEAMALEHLGQIHYELHDFAQAVSSATEALSIYRGTNNQRKIANCLRSLSSMERSRGNFAEAHDLLQQALALHRKLDIPLDLMADLMQLGVEYAEQNSPRQALVHFAESLAISQKINAPLNETILALQASRAHLVLGELDKAKELLERSLTLSRTTQNRLLEAEAQHDLAQLALRQGHYNEAQAQIEAALRLIESSRNSLTNPATRAEYRSTKQSYYEIYLESLMARHREGSDPKLIAQALEAAERARARMLLELLTEARIDIRQGVNSELLNRERVLQQRLSAKTELFSQFSTSKKNSEQAKLAKLLEAEIVTLTADLRDIESQIRAQSPAYAALTQPQPLKLAEVQQQVLDRNTLMLEYALGSERSYLFAVTPTSLKVFTLPKRDEIQNAARRFHELLSRQQQPTAFSSVAAKQKWAAQLDQETEQAAEALSRMILSPAAAELNGKRLLIVPDDALHYVPFAALPELVTGGQSSVAGKKTAKSSPLVANHEIISLPSASTLAMLRRELASRAAAPKTLAVLADPVFSANDERVRVPLAQPLAQATSKANDRAVSGVGATGEGNTVQRLTSSRVEAEAILALVPVAERKAALDFAANEALIESGELGQFRYLHFATHGFLNAARPEQSGILLSLVDSAGNSQPGMLTTQDVFRLKLPAEMVALSGCRTGLGKEISGEGLVGLTRGFMYAGARRVLASLWQVNDAATAELMKNFYRGVLGEKKLSPAAALRAAQLEMLKQNRWRSPYYWAPFTLQGDW